MEKFFIEKKNIKCFLLIVNRKKSFDKSLKGDFNLENNLINRKNEFNLNYIYTGLQIIKSPPKHFNSRMIDFPLCKRVSSKRNLASK